MLFGNLTVRETFRFAANVRLPAAISQDTRMQASVGEEPQMWQGPRPQRGNSAGERHMSGLCWPAYCGWARAKVGMSKRLRLLVLEQPLPLLHLPLLLPPNPLVVP